VLQAVHNEVLGRPVAVKVISAALASDPLLRAATWTEARAAARLTHPHVTQVYDCGEASLPNGTEVAYLVTELVDGQSLADRLRFGPLPWRQAVETGAQVAAALAAAHRVGVVHRDLEIHPGGASAPAVNALDWLAEHGAEGLDGAQVATAGVQTRKGGVTWTSSRTSEPSAVRLSCGALPAPC
jgi:serine/threonine protein kinase